MSELVIGAGEEIIVEAPVVIPAIESDFTVAWGLVTDAGVLVNGAGATVSRDVTGRYKIILLSPGIDGADMMPTFTPLHISGLIRLKAPTVISVSDTQKDVFFFNTLNAGIDTYFYFKIERLPT